jgi:hypothetical protein
MMPLQSNGTNYTDKDNKMAMKKVVKITGTAKSTGGNMKSQAMKKVVVAKSADAARATAMAKKTTPKRPTGELPKRLSGFGRVIAQDYPELGKSGAGARAGKIRDSFTSSAAAAKKAQANKAAIAKKAK